MFKNAASVAIFTVLGLDCQYLLAALRRLNQYPFVELLSYLILLSEDIHLLCAMHEWFYV